MRRTNIGEFEIHGLQQPSEPSPSPVHLRERDRERDKGRKGGERGRERERGR